MSEPIALPSQEYLKECFDYNPETGIVVWKERPLHHFKNEHGMKIQNTKRAGVTVGTHIKYYLKVMLNDISYSLHRIIWKLHYGVDPTGVIDHVNLNKTDNRLLNLRDVTHSVNNYNKNITAANTSGIKGVSFDKSMQKWRAAITIRGNVIRLGSFVNKEDAIKARKEAELKDWSHLESKEVKRKDFELTFDYLQECFTFNESDSRLYWKARPVTHFKTESSAKQWNAKYENIVAGCLKNDNYYYINLHGKDYCMHRLIYWLLSGINPADNLVDHINCDKSDNSFSNLRLATRQQNSMNKNLNSTSKSGFKGVYYRAKTNKYIAQIKINGKSISLGVYDDPQSAHEAYCKASTELHSEFANHG